MEKTFSIKVPEVVPRMTAIYYVVGLWNERGNLTVIQAFYFVLFSAFAASSFVGIWTSENVDNAVFLIVIFLILVIQSYRLYFIIVKQNEILSFMARIVVNSTDDFEAYCNAKNKIKIMYSLAMCFIAIAYTLCVGVAVMPLIRKKLLFDVAFPWDYRAHEYAFWLAYGMVASGYTLSVTLLMFVSMIWYMMQIFVVKFDLLGNQFQNLGEQIEQKNLAKNLTESQRHETTYFQRLMKGIRELEIVNKYN